MTKIIHVLAAGFIGYHNQAEQYESLLQIGEDHFSVWGIYENGKYEVHPTFRNASGESVLIHDLLTEPERFSVNEAVIERMQEVRMTINHDYLIFQEETD